MGVVDFHDLVQRRNLNKNCYSTVAVVLSSRAGRVRGRQPDTEPESKHFCIIEEQQTIDVNVEEARLDV